MLSEKEVGQRMKECRLEAGMTLQDVAASVGVSNSTILRYEQGEIKKMKIPVVESIAKALHVNPAWLLGKSEAKYTINFNATPDPEWVYLEGKLRDGTISDEEFQRFKDMFHEETENVGKAMTLLNERIGRILINLVHLNDLGQQKVEERIDEMMEIPKYQRQPPTAHTEAPNATQEGRDITQPERPTEGPSEHREDDTR